MSSTDIGLEDTTPLDPEARARVDSFRLQKGRERIALLEAELAFVKSQRDDNENAWQAEKQKREELEARAPSDGAMVLELQLSEARADRVKLQDEIDGINGALTREWSLHAMTRRELVASRKAHENAIRRLQRIEAILIDRHLHATLKIAQLQGVIREP